MQTLVRVLLWPVGAAAAVFLLTAAWQVDDVAAGSVPTASRAVGTCGAYTSVEEFYNRSDVSPPVPCTRPHQTEVIAVHKYQGPLANQRARPGLEALATLGTTLCQGEDLRGYLGGDARADWFGIQPLVRFPTPDEWAAGDRTYRCELTPASSVDGAVPHFDNPLRGILARPEGATVRHCRADTGDVTCDRPHTIEFVNAWLPAGTPGACEPFVREFLGGPPESVGTAAAAVALSANTTACVVISPGARPTTGSLAGAARRSAR
jgi:hypothetical protein